jgi:hypothetical protein
MRTSGERTQRRWGRTAVALFSACSLLFVDTSCHVSKITRVDVAQAPSVAHERIAGVTTVEGKDVSFDPPGGVIINGAIQANVNQSPYSLSLSQVQRLWVERRGISTVRTIGLTAGIVVAALGAIAAVVAATKESCPFVYSWDGERYIFDAEPYGGAISRGLERNDYGELEHLKASGGEYRLLLTNEVDETQHTNLLELWVVDHAPGCRVIADEAGTLYALRNLEALQSARDREGRDITAWLKDADQRIWEPDARPTADGGAREELILTFSKPEGATTANLVVNGATSLWGSYMVKKMTQLRGREAALWLASLEGNKDQADALRDWYAREELYRLKVEVEEPTGWIARGRVPNGGPLIAEDRVIPLDLSRVAGTQLRIRLRPPVGFWAFNSFAISYDAASSPTPEVVKLRAARTSSGADVRRSLLAEDSAYYSMPDNNETAELRFPAPPAAPGMARTVILHTRGWYELHLGAEGEPDKKALEEITTVPDAAARFAAREFANWHLKP